MIVNYEQWEKILSAVNNDKGLNKDNVIDKIKEKLGVEGKDEYEEWSKASFDVNHRFKAEDDTLTLLHLAAHNNLEKMASALLGLEGININAVDELYFWTPLYWAIWFKSEKAIIDILLKAEGINVNAVNEDGLTPLHAAAQWNNREAVDALLTAKK